MKFLVALVATGVACLLATAALAGNSEPVRINGIDDPPVGAVVAQAQLLPNGSCELPDGGVTIVASEGAPTVELTAGCAVVYVGDGTPPVTVPGGVTDKARP